ncbi:MFS transporter [Acholeplasma equirhinis]|uniref:MFS transporter n=1 Tax=Acholeplasma equirhinis TaxID=555393 RepID=UPI00197AD719|nr:MFS transporter [Acholeplasma equirhinis]MBN3490597.1 MFS transporter [Acholeplasma equirhinis]
MNKSKKQTFLSILLLAVIYIAFIALGLPDALLGSAWNLVRVDLNVGLGSLGIMTVVIYIMSIISTYNAPRLLKLFQTKWITFVSIAFTGLALIFLSMINEFWQMLFFAIPLGIGAGAIDVSLNHYLTKNYKASHMSFMHSFYGIGVTAGPSIMAYTLSMSNWRTGYVIVGSILILIAMIVLLSFKLWKKETEFEKAEHDRIPLKTALKIKGAVNSMFIFLLYVHIESLLGVWISSYMYQVKGSTLSTAALAATTYYLGLTLGRLLSGIFAKWIKPKALIQIGILLIGISVILFILDFDFEIYYFVVIGLIGIGCGPIYPNMMFINNDYYKPNEISKVMSFQMVIGYMGFGILTPLAGLLFDRLSIELYPFVLLFSTTVLIVLLSRYMKLKTQQSL